MNARLRQAFESPFLMALVGAAVVAASMSLTGNLTVGGTATITGVTDVTAKIVARGGVQLTSTSGPTIQTIASDPNGVTSGTRGDLRLRTDSARVYQNTNNATAWVEVTTSTSAPSAFYFSSGIDGDCNFNGVATPVCGASLSGGVYTMTRDIVPRDIAIATGVTLSTDSYGIWASRDITCAGTGKIANNGNNASGATGGTGKTAHTYGNSIAGVNGALGAGANGNASANAPFGAVIGSAAGGNTPTWHGADGSVCQGGGGGGCSSCAAAGGSGGGATATVAQAHSSLALYTGRTFTGATQFTSGGTGGAGGGKASGTSNGGGSGASGGYVVVVARSSTCPMEAKGGNGGNGGGTEAGGGAGGAGGVIWARFLAGTAPTATVWGGTGGLHSGGVNTGDGGDGGDCISSVCVGYSCSTCYGGLQGVGATCVAF